MSRDDEYTFDDFLEEKIDEYKRETVKKLSCIVDDGHVTAFANILAIAFFNNSEDAERVVGGLGLTDEHMFSQVGDVEWLRKVFIARQEQDEADYHEFLRDEE